MRSAAGRDKVLQGGEKFLKRKEFAFRLLEG